jgi:hypothetical protein
MTQCISCLHTENPHGPAEILNLLFLQPTQHTSKGNSHLLHVVPRHG